MSFIKNYKIFQNNLELNQKIDFYFLIILLIFQSILELFSLSMVLPLLGLLLDSSNYKFIFFDINLKKYSVFVISFIICLFIFKTLTLYLISKRTFNFAYTYEANLKKFIFNNFIKQSYSKFLYSNTSELISNISVNLRLLTQNYVVPVLTLLTDGMILITILIFLIFYEPIGFLILFIFSVTSILTLKKFVGSILKSIGSDKEKSENILVKTIEHTIGSIKFSKLYNMNDFFIKTFNFHNFKSSLILGKYFTYQQLPRFTLELFGLLSIIVLIIYFKAFNFEAEQTISTVAIFSAAGFKIIPSINRIILSLQAIKFSDSVIKTINDIKNNFTNDKKIENQIKKRNIIKNFRNQIEFINISYFYPETNEKILDNANMIIKKNKFYGITGESGAGKTTLVDIIVGLIQPSEGVCKIDDKLVNLVDTDLSKLVAYVPQNTFLLNDSIKNNISLSFDDNYNQDKMVQVIKNSSLQSLIDSKPEGLDMIVGEKGVRLSGGQAQRIAIARALYRNAQILILDEPTSSLDSLNEELIVKNINEISGVTKIMISHNEKILQNCDLVFHIDKGKLIVKTN